jgi:hypothetical protein
MKSMVAWEFRLWLLMTVVLKEEERHCISIKGKIIVQHKSWLQIWMIPGYLPSGGHIFCDAWFVSLDRFGLYEQKFLIIQDGDISLVPSFCLMLYVSQELHKRDIN